MIRQGTRAGWARVRRVLLRIWLSLKADASWRHAPRGC
jgi:hypothetical protein